MWVQIIQGKAKDPAGIRKQSERWRDELRPTAKGFLGSTSGVTDDGEFITVARFENKELAVQNSDDPKQTEWWNETSQYLDDVIFRDCEEVDTFYGGGSDQAGFVQVIQFRTDDWEGLKQMFRRDEDSLRDFRPDVLGGISAYDGDLVTQVIYFTSEKEAREGEKKEAPPEMAQANEEMGRLMADARFLDIRDPEMTS